ncbi:MAG TPA: SGNH/GDSL hydrolase family protein [Opitutaceae bacterium]|nr:SGNH/GDSL hydrolase family protein [Opitutaceae bacterium]
MRLAILCSLSALAWSPPPAAAAAPWVGSWATATQPVQGRDALEAASLPNATLRQVVRISLGGERLRIRLSNAFGAAPLHLDSVRVARALQPGAARIDPATDTAVLFDGKAEVWIPPGAEYLSDPVPLAVPAFSDLAISFHYLGAPDRQTGHPGSRAKSFEVAGDAASAADLPGARVIEHWYQLAGVDVPAPPGGAALVAFGDSITDGHASTTDGNDRWTDFLAHRLVAGSPAHPWGMLNLGIGGNRILMDGIGPNALARFDRDVLAEPGAAAVLVLEGVNDLGGLAIKGEVPQAAHDALVARLIGAYRQMIARGHQRGIRMIGATILPYGGSGYYHPGARSEADRIKLNEWIRESGEFDGVVDWDAALRDPKNPSRLNPAYDCGDGLHPSPAGYRRMAETVPPGLFAGR